LVNESQTTKKNFFQFLNFLGDVTSLKLPFHPPENLGEADQRLLTRMDRAFKVNRLRIAYKMKRKEDATAIISYATRGLCW
jgi:hypothetical protein